MRVDVDLAEVIRHRAGWYMNGDIAIYEPDPPTGWTGGVRLAAHPKKTYERYAARISGPRGDGRGTALGSGREAVSWVEKMIEAHSLS